MISSIFGKTKPINYIFLLVFLVIFYVLTQFYVLNLTFLTWNVGQGALAVLSLLATVVLLDVIVKRNKLTGNNSYAMLYFTLLVVLFPQILGDHASLLCNFFLVLALRSVLRFKSMKSLRFKIFDATFWVLVASLFHVWALLFLLLVLLAIYIFEPKNLGNWLAPIPAVISFFLVVYAAAFLLGMPQYPSEHYSFTIHLTTWWTAMGASRLLAFFYLLLILLMGIYTLVRTGKKGLGKLISFRILFFAFIVALFVILLTWDSGTGIIVVTFVPAAVFLASYIQSVKRERILEILLMCSIFIPCLVFIFHQLLP